MLPTLGQTILCSGFCHWTGGEGVGGAADQPLHRKSLLQRLHQDDPFFFFQTASSSRVLFASCPTYCHCVPGANFGGALEDCRVHMCAGRPRGPPASPDASVFAYAAHRKERNGIALPLLSPPLF